ncbi:hypothetical protein [Pseudomonas chlororaphis]|uniref:hypothetical protein n=1 Tax=Pseudomonas chlororaphis TaxID=587753 RepID=UPI0013DE4C98|nr:hypothetical protein [Pseudomonas chlororaphis]
MQYVQRRLRIDKQGRDRAVQASDGHVPGDTRSQVAINRQRAIEPGVEVGIDLGDGKTLGIVSDGFGVSKISLRGLKSDGASQPIADFVWSNPNSGSSLGDLSVRMNGRSASAFRIAADGSIGMDELKTAANVSGSPAGTLYVDAGALKVVV